MKTPKSIAIVDPVGAKAGMDWYGIQLLRAFHKMGWQTCFLSNCNQEDDRVSVFNVFKNQKDRGVKSLLKIIKGLFAARSILQKNKTQIVILHIFRSDWLELLFSMVFYRAGFKVCLIIHDIESLDTGKNSLSRKWILSRYHHYKVVHNAYSERELKKIIPPGDSVNLHVIPHGDFTEMIKNFAKEEKAFEPDPFDKAKINLLFFGQIKKVKGLDVLLNAMPQLDNHFKLTVAGKERDESISGYSVMIADLEEKGKITIINRHISDSERDFLLKKCDAVILPYRHIYQSGVLLMAMSYGKTIVASDLPAFKEIIIPPTNGFLFENGNADSLASVLTQLKSADLQKIGATAKAFVMQHYGWNQIAGLYVRMFVN